MFLIVMILELTSTVYYRLLVKLFDEGAYVKYVLPVFKVLSQS